MIINSLLDRSIYFSFDRTGFERHSKDFKQLDWLHIKNSFHLITGGTSGIGNSIIHSLEKNAVNFKFTGRQLRDQELSSKFIELDLADHQAVLKMANDLPNLDGLVLNAGGMPEKYLELNGFEFQFASQLLGHYILIRRLIDLKKFNQHSHVIWMSSGGMYMVPYKKEIIKDAEKNYDKVNTYANVKRAQIIINDELHQKYHQLGITFSVMHPGWVDTPGVRDAIPGFYQFTKNRLRSPEQGADTALWLLSEKNLTSGEFWFDRKIQKKIMFPWTRNSTTEKQELIELCENYYQSILPI